MQRERDEQAECPVRRPWIQNQRLHHLRERVVPNRALPTKATPTSDGHTAHKRNRCALRRIRVMLEHHLGENREHIPRRTLRVLRDLVHGLAYAAILRGERGPEHACES